MAEPNLQILSNNFTRLFSRSTAAEEVSVFDKQELGAVPSMPLEVGLPGSPNVTPLWVMYTSSAGTNITDAAHHLKRLTEVDLFLLDGRAFTDTSLDTVPLLEDEEDSAHAWNVLIGDKAHAPAAAAMCAPPTFDEEVQTLDFLLPPLLSGQAALPNGTGSIKSVRTYDHGLCSATEAFGRGDDLLGCGLYTTVLETMFGAFADAVDNASGFTCGARPVDYYSHASTFLDHSNDLMRAGEVTPDDGFVLDVKWGAHEDFFCADAHIHLTAKMALFLGSDGVLSTTAEGPIRDFGGGTGFSSFAQKLQHATTTTLPEKFHEAARQSQSFVVPIPGRGGSAFCSKVSECEEVAQGELALAVKEGAMSQNVIPHDADLLAAAVGGNHFNERDWICAPKPAKSCGETGRGGNVCQFVIPAKRVNVYPDEVELVWFDDEKEFDNPALAVWYATFFAGGSSGREARDKLCAFTPPAPSNERAVFFQRPLGAVSVNPGAGP